MKYKSVWVLLLIFILFPQCNPELPLYYPQTSILIEVFDSSIDSVVENYYTKYVILEPRYINNINYDGYLYLWDAQSGRTRLVLSGEFDPDTFTFTHQSRVKNLQGDEDILYYEYFDFKITESSSANYKLDMADPDSTYDYKLIILK